MPADLKTCLARLPPIFLWLHLWKSALSVRLASSCWCRHAQVVYTDQLPTYADPILDRLDPQRFIQYRLYRDSTQYTDGHHVRFDALLTS